jgi:hypothetical protein
LIDEIFNSLSSLEMEWETVESFSAQVSQERDTLLMMKGMTACK